MSEIIYLQVGERDRFPLKNFVTALRNFLGLLEDLDATISERRGGSVRWEVIVLKKESPGLVGVVGEPISRKFPAKTERVQAANICAPDSSGFFHLTRRIRGARIRRFAGPMNSSTSEIR